MLVMTSTFAVKAAGLFSRRDRRAAASRPRTGEEVLYQMGRDVVDAFSRVMLHTDLVQQTPLPEGPKIYAANHPTTVDPFLLGAFVPEPISILVTEMAFNVPLFGAYMHKVGHIPVRAGRGREAFETALDRLAAGRSVGIFPEGALSPEEGGLCPPRTGAARLAMLSGAPIVPLGIDLDRQQVRYLPTEIEGDTATARVVTRGPYAVTIGAPLWVTGSLDDREHVVAEAERIMHHIGSLARASAIRRLDRAESMGMRRAQIALA